MQKTMTFAKELDEAQQCRIEIDKLFRAMERSMERVERLRADTKRVKAETRKILTRIEAH